MIADLKPYAGYKESGLPWLGRVPGLEVGGTEAFIRCEEMPYTPDLWIKAYATKNGYEVSVICHFYKLQPLRIRAEISADIIAIEKEAEGLLDGVLKLGSAS